MTDDLDPQLYDELRRMAHGYMRRERAAHTLQPTALVHEAYLRIADHMRANEGDRGPVLGIAARAMRNILVDHARRKAAGKRGGGARAVTLPNVAAGGEAPVDLLVLDECLTELDGIDDLKCRIVELMFFAGLSIPETAASLGLGTRAVEKHWSLARTWLRSRLA